MKKELSKQQNQRQRSFLVLISLFLLQLQCTDKKESMLSGSPPHDSSSHPSVNFDETTSGKEEILPESNGNFTSINSSSGLENTGLSGANNTSPFLQTNSQNIVNNTTTPNNSSSPSPVPTISTSMSIENGYIGLKSGDLLKNLLRLIATSPEIEQSFQVFNGVLPANTAQSVITPSMVGSVLNITGEVCKFLVEKEAVLPSVTRKVFASVNFLDATLPDEVIRDSFSNRLAILAWLRPATLAETAIFLELRNKLIAESPATISSMKNVLTGICIAQLASIQTLSL